MRYNEQAVQPPKKQKEEKKPRELPKKGTYTGEDLRTSRDIPWRR